MKIRHFLSGQAAQPEVAERMKNPAAVQLMNNVTLTDQEIIFRRYAKMTYIPYSEIVWAYRQVAQSHVTLGCCGGVLQEFRVQMRAVDGRMTMLNFDREPNAIEVMDAIKAHNPDAAIGFTAENKARFGVTDANKQK